MTSPGRPSLVLIVDDNETCAVTLQIALESLPGIDLQIASSGAAALRVISTCQHRVGAVITDLQLPGISGLDLLKHLRSQPKFASTPVLIISGDSDPRLPRMAVASGANGFFTKPYSPSEVRKRVEQLLV
jgi:two-component system chemotaxis response regulator CheY